jgi:predicted kinase
MRQWMRERMRRRSKRGTNDSESTGKIGQEIPTGQPTPLQPIYPEDSRARAAEEPVGADMEMSHDADGDISQDVDTDTSQDVDTGMSQEADRAEIPEQLSAATEQEKQEEGAKSLADAEFHATPAEAAEGKLVLETQPESPSQPPPELPPASPKTPKGYVVLAIGLPGSGKTTWFKRRGVMPLSSDMLRSILFDNITEQRYQGLVFSTLRSLLRARLIAKMPWNYVDATNLSPHERRQWIKMAKSFGYEVQAVFFDVPYEICMERNRRRERVVNEEIMQKMAERLRPPSFKEGFSKITLVRVKPSAPAKPQEGEG